MFTPFMIPLYLFYGLLDVCKAKCFQEVSYKNKRRIVKLLNRCELYDSICFLLPLARKEFYKRVRSQFFFDTDSDWVDSIAHKVKDYTTNILRCNPISWWANICGQQLIMCVRNSKYLFTDWCRLRGDYCNVYFSYSTFCGCLKIIKHEYYDEEDNSPVNLFFNCITGKAKNVQHKKTILFKRFIFTKKQTFKAFKDLNKQYPDFWSNTFWLKYECLYSDLGEAEAWLTGDMDNVSYFEQQKFKKGFAFRVLTFLSTQILYESDLQCERNKLVYIIVDNHRHINKKEVLNGIKNFREELLKYDERKLKMIWE